MDASTRARIVVIGKDGKYVHARTQDPPHARPHTTQKEQGKKKRTRTHAHQARTLTYAQKIHAGLAQYETTRRPWIDLEFD